MGHKMKLTNILFNKKIKESVEKIDFNKASQIITYTKINKLMNQKLLFTRYSIFTVIIIIEILLASTLSGWVFSSPIFALMEWLVILLTIIYFFKIISKCFSENYLTRFYSCCSIIFSIVSCIFSLGLWFVLAAFSSGIKEEYLAQILLQTIITVVFAILVGYAIYKYLQYLAIKELADFDKTLKVPLWGRIVDKSVIYGIVIVIGGMQVYRMNKFWLLNDSSWVSTLLVPIAQTVLGAIIFILLIALPVRFFTRNS